MQGHREGRVGSPILSGGVQSSLTYLSCRSQGVLMYPLQLLMGNVSLATLLVTTAQPTAPIAKPTPATPPTVAETPAPPMGSKQWHCLSNWEAASPRSGEAEATVLDVTPEEQPHQRWKDRRPLAKLPKESCCKAFLKDTEIVKAARQAYYPSQKGMFTQEGSYDLT